MTSARTLPKPLATPSKRSHMNRFARLLFAAPLAVIGCADPAVVMPRAIVDVNIGPSAKVGSCGFVPSDEVSIGCAGAASKCAGNSESRYLPVAHGGYVAGDGTPSDTGVEVHVYCTITSLNNTFDVKVSALRIDPQSPTTSTEKFTMYGTIAPTRDAQPVTVTASNRTLASFRNGSEGCTLSFPDPQMGIASGRLWGVVSCANATIPSQESRECTLAGTVRFENCGE